MKKKWELRHRDLDLWLKVTNFTRVWASAVSNHLAKTASKSVHPFGWNFVHKKTVDTQTDRQTDTHTHTHTQTNCSENITPPRFRGGVIKLNRTEFMITKILLFICTVFIFSAKVHKLNLKQWYNKHINVIPDMRVIVTYYRFTTLFWFCICSR